MIDISSDSLTIRVGYLFLNRAYRDITLAVFKNDHYDYRVLTDLGNKYDLTKLVLF
jgi:glucuronate isomerase